MRAGGLRRRVYPRFEHLIHTGLNLRFTHKYLRIQSETHSLGEVSGMKSLILLFLILTAPMGASPLSVQTSLPASGTWLRLPVIPWPDWQPGHRGLDIQAPIDTEVFSPVKGSIVWAGRIGRNFGVTIAGPQMTKHTITGIDSNLEIGSAVRRGQFIGWSIASQHCENLDCIHWSVRQKGRYLDPRWLLKPIVYRLPNVKE